MALAPLTFVVVVDQLAHLLAYTFCIHNSSELNHSIEQATNCTMSAAAAAIDPPMPSAVVGANAERSKSVLSAMKKQLEEMYNVGGALRIVHTCSDLPVGHPDHKRTKLIRDVTSVNVTPCAPSASASDFPVYAVVEVVFRERVLEMDDDLREIAQISCRTTTSSGVLPFTI